MAGASLALKWDARCACHSGDPWTRSTISMSLSLFLCPVHGLDKRINSGFLKSANCLCLFCRQREFARYHCQDALRRCLARIDGFLPGIDICVHLLIGGGRKCGFTWFLLGL